jgi:hypothetical protein
MAKKNRLSLRLLKAERDRKAAYHREWYAKKSSEQRREDREFKDARTILRKLGFGEVLEELDKEIMEETGDIVGTF